MVSDPKARERLETGYLEQENRLHAAMVNNTQCTRVRLPVKFSF